MPFLTLEDPNAKIKGSRDPLGILPVWSAFGRHVVINLTSQTTSVRGFTILMLGRYFAERLIGEHRVPVEDALDVVLRMEMIGAHIRHAAHHVTGDIRGIERVRKFQEEGHGRVYIETTPRGLILLDQKTVGLWGLYTVSGRNSGLLSDGPAGVTDDARAFVEANYVSRLNGAEKPLLRLLERDGWLDTRGGNAVFDGLAPLLSETFTPAEFGFYRDRLADARATVSPHPDRQATFRKLLETRTDLGGPLGREEALTLLEAARHDDAGLAERLERIVRLESFLAPASAVFDHVLVQPGQTPRYVAEHLAKHWGSSVPNLDRGAFAEILPEIREHSSPTIASAIDRTHAALQAGRYEEAIRGMLEWNAQVMAGRKAGPWVTLADDGRLDVRYRGEDRLLPDRVVLPTIWANSYFINALKSITRQLQRTA